MNAPTGHEPPCLPGDRIRITKPIVNVRNDFIPVETSLPVGTEGTVLFTTFIVWHGSADDQINVKWDNGSRLSLWSPTDDGCWEVIGRDPDAG